jgi:hypothetical protein
MFVEYFSPRSKLQNQINILSAVELMGKSFKTWKLQRLYEIKSISSWVIIYLIVIAAIKTKNVGVREMTLNFNFTTKLGFARFVNGESKEYLKKNIIICLHLQNSSLFASFSVQSFEIGSRRASVRMR